MDPSMPDEVPDLDAINAELMRRGLPPVIRYPHNLRRFGEPRPVPEPGEPCYYGERVEDDPIIVNG